MKFAVIFSRFASFVIDYILYGLIYYFLLKLGVAGFVLANLIFFAYRVLSSTFFDGTIGMRLLRLKIYNNSFKNIIKREIFRIASAFYYIGYLYAFLDKEGRCFHDIASGTYVGYEKRELEKGRGIILIYVLFFIAFLKYSSSFLLNEVGLIGLKKIASSDVYYQSFEGDNLLSLSSDELYLKTLGRKYTAVVDIAGQKVILRISNKLSYSEIYRLNFNGNRLIGEFLYRINLPLQYISSVNFRGRQELLGVSPKGDIVLIDEKGKVVAKNRLTNFDVFMLKCGDLDGDSFDEAVLLDRNGNVEVFKYDDGIKLIYSGKVGEDIIPQCFCIDKGIYLVTKANDRNLVYHYTFEGGRFKFQFKKDLKKNGINNIFKYNDGFLVSSIYRNNMTLRIGRIQKLEFYDKNLKRIYNFGNRRARLYAFYVRNVEDVGDGSLEIVLKAVGSSDVYGQGYIVEIYKPTKLGLFINRILTMME
ncbi:MAG: RDD family protein [Caloramator sp.]|nr:RDD family protein [Caloramator sp.]